ncbi:MAG: hypothetical protein K0R71_237 [Bacillales bacterium]|jgi:prepilin-type N-terminal cleavage/methylation domain-containing protein|nr:hypothetical protein [Bacillales bacterium]
MFNKKGFTLVEIIVVLVILFILAGIGIPAYLKYIDDSKEKVCKINRTSLNNYYKKYSVLFEDSPSLKDVIDSKGNILSSQFSQDVQTYICPSGGVFYIENSVIKCTKHDDGIGNENGGGIEEPQKTLRELLANVNSESWLAICNRVTTTEKEVIEEGSFVEYEDKIYVASQKVTLNPNEAKTYVNNISDFKFMTYLDPNRPIFGPSNVDKSTNTWNVQLNEGSIYQEGEKTYLYRGQDNQTQKPFPPNGNWVELNFTK